MTKQQGDDLGGKYARPSVLPQGWLSRVQAARVLGISLRTLGQWRRAGYGPPAAFLTSKWAWDKWGQERVPGREGVSVIYYEGDVELFAEWQRERRCGCRAQLALPDWRQK